MVQPFFFICILSVVSSGWSQHCGHPGRPKYSPVVGNDSSYQIGDKIQYNCTSGYELVTPSGDRLITAERQCLPSGTWSNEHLLCYRRETLYGRMVSRNCDNSNWLATQEWIIQRRLKHDSTISLVEVELEQETRNVRVMLLDNCGNQTEMRLKSSTGTSFTFQLPISGRQTTAGNSACLAREVQLYASQSFRLCFLAAYEAPVLCGDPETPANGQFSYRYNSTVAHYSCNPGYRLQGSMIRRCHRGLWTGTQAVCEQIVDEDMISTSQLQLPSETLSIAALGVSICTLLILLTYFAFKYSLRHKTTGTTRCASILFTNRNRQNKDRSGRRPAQLLYDDCNSVPNFSTVNEETYEEIPNGHLPTEAPIYAQPVKKGQGR